MGKLAAVGWLLAIAIGGAAFAGYQWLLADKQTALDAQAAEFEVRLAQVKAESAGQLQKAQSDAIANEQVLKTELDFQRLPDMPLKFAFRPGQVLYVESEAADVFQCKVRLFRPNTSASVELDFSINSRAFKDLGAIETWVFARGDQVEFVKSGFKPWKGVVP